MTNQQQQQSSSSQDAVPWHRLKHFEYSHGKDAIGIMMSMGKCVILGGGTVQDNDKAAKVYEWNVRRCFPFAALETPRFGGTGVNWNDKSLWVLGGSNDTGCVLSSVEMFSLSQDSNPEWKWTESTDMPTPRVYASAVAVPTEQVILVVGGRNANWQELDTVEIAKVDDNNDSSLSWSELSKPMPGPRMGCASLLINETSLLVLGGYDGRSWQRTVFLYEFSLGKLDQGKWQTLPDMLDTVRFVKAVRYYKYVLVIGEKEDLSSSASAPPTTCVQCYDTQRREWTWLKTCSSCPPLDMVTLQGPNLYGFSAGSNNTDAEAGIYSCGLSQLDPQMVSDVIPIAVGTTPTADVEAPTIVATDAVLVAEDTSTSNHTPNGTISAQPYTPEGPIRIRNVVRIKLNEKSYYTGQLRKKDGTYVPHGQGLLVWVEDDNKDGSMDSNQQQASSSYYKGQFLNGFRHGLGEMYLRVEDKHYFGSFEYGSWDGMGSLKIRNRGFTFFGQFVGGEMTGKGRCSYRVKQDDQWKQKTYAGGFNRGRAHGKGVIADYLTGRIEVDREFHEEDIFHLGSATPEVRPSHSIDA